ncbi:hypothetical protein AMJ39_09205 [candidate division TA06 bacterium DG_24]|uniref:Uncharacterized protein n=3 Tax=Bacteria division TA06 TaxID=1156500 RepID=A0A0S8J921_UNCT6|nr:MAG: hypothetical protein AMJ39_09205 [candidate division TA06 bacterium DG_24]KPK67139.1 MAG: hypothetical protein AMJ82_11190 [candidate division TA06 bacterium SM23_40]KPL05984.1 MAG: hypothetical protein AMJ71_10235 [candidate division TA06 bacterium SM1_40]
MKTRFTLKQRARDQGEGGFILVVALMLTMLIALLGAAFLAYVPFELQRTDEATGRDVAIEAADAGFQDVIQNLIQDARWDGYENPDDPVVLTDPESGKIISAFTLDVHTGVDQYDRNVSPPETLQGIQLGYDLTGMKRIGVISTGYKLTQEGNIRMKGGSPDPNYARRVFALVVTLSPSDYVLFTGGWLTIVNGGTWNGKIHANEQININNYSTVPGLNDTIYLNAPVSSPTPPDFGGSHYPYTGPNDPRIVSTASPPFINTTVLPMPYLDLSPDGPFMQATHGDPDSGYYNGHVERFDRWSTNSDHGLWFGEVSDTDFFAQSFIQSTGPNPEDTIRVIEREVGSGVWKKWWVQREGHGQNSFISVTAIDSVYNPLDESYGYRQVPVNWHPDNPAEEGCVLFVHDGTAVVGNVMVDGRVSIVSGTDAPSHWKGSILIDGDIKYSDVDYSTDPPTTPPETKERPCGLGLFATDRIFIADKQFQQFGIPCADDTLTVSAQIITEQGVFRALYNDLPVNCPAADRKFTLVGAICSYRTPELSRAYGRRFYNYDLNLNRVKLPALPRIVYLYPGSWRILPMS